MCAQSRSLLKEFVEHRSESAFTDLVQAHIDLVYSAARRIVAGDTHLAEDVTQTVFADLAKKAPRLPEEIILSVWLYRRTFYVASSMIRTEQRRRHREQEALAMNANHEPDAIDWALLEPHLDRTLNELSEADRQAIVLRFFEKLDLRAVGEQLGVGEDAARKRVSRALEKLRTKFAKRGLKLSVTGISASLLANAVTAAPVALAGQTATLVLAGSVAGTGMIFTIQQFLSMNAVKSIAGIVLAAGIAVPMILQHQTIGALHAENATLAQEFAEFDALRAENDRLAKLAVDYVELEALRKEHLDLLRLRGEWTLMRNQIEELQAELERQRLLLAAKSASEEDPVADEERERNRQVTIEARMVELPVDSSIWREFGFRAPSSASDGGANGVLNSPDTAKLMERLAAAEGVDVMFAPRVTTSNGRQTQIKSVERKNVITDISNGVATTGQLEIGPVIDVLPSLEKGGHTISLDMVISLNRLLTVDEREAAAAAGLPPEFAELPMVEERQFKAAANIWDGQSVIITGGRSTHSGGARALMVIVTSTEIDRAGKFLVVPVNESSR